jgi:phytol kinase
MTNLLGLLISVSYILAMIGMAELLRRKRDYSSDFTRKVIHIGVGMMSWALRFLFDTPWFFIGACGAFVILNLLDWRYGFVASMASSDRSNLGTVYFPLVAAVVAYLFWDRQRLLVAALMPLTWGDGMAPVIGRAFGHHRYRVHQTVRSLEGSIGFFAASLLWTWLALTLVGGPPSVTAAGALLLALLVAAATTVIEAISILGLDNLTITAVAVLILSSWSF